MKNYKKVLKGIAVTVICMMLHAMPVTASAGAISGLNNFRNLLGEIISVIGSFYLLWGIFEFANSLMGNDGVMQASAFKKIGAGFLAMAAPEIFTLLKGSGTGT